MTSNEVLTEDRLDEYRDKLDNVARCHTRSRYPNFRGGEDEISNAKLNDWIFTALMVSIALEARSDKKPGDLEHRMQMFELVVGGILDAGRWTEDEIVLAWRVLNGHDIATTILRDLLVRFLKASKPSVADVVEVG
jgi:hypothetical protein